MLMIVSIINFKVFFDNIGKIRYATFINQGYSPWFWSVSPRTRVIL